MADERAQVRAIIFNHLAGMAMAPTVRALAERGAFDMLREAPGVVVFEEIAAQTRANRGYLRVALRLLASAGWLTQHMEPSGRVTAYKLTDAGRTALRIAPAPYADVTDFLPKAISFDEYLLGASDDALVPALRGLVNRARRGWEIGGDGSAGCEAVRQQIRGHLDGAIVGPAMVAIARSGILGQLERGPVEIGELPGNTASLELVFDLLGQQGWVTRSGGTLTLTQTGRYAAQIAPAYGVTVSYLPMFSMLPTLLFGNARIPRVDEQGFEVLVNRAMNVWGSGGAHKTYFRKVDEIVEEIFNRPLNQQPRGICDMGCGDGTFLEHLYQVVKERTLRGQELDREPLLIIGADFNKVARRVTKQTLRRAGIPTFHVIPGDILRPAQLAGDLEKLNIDSHELLHIRSFLDHNRPFAQLSNYTRGTRKARTTGAFAYLGEEILADELEENLVRHLRRWAPYIGRFGLLVLELHTLPPEVAAANLERTPAVAYDATHGYSDQYLVEVPVFVECAREAGLHPAPRFQSRFPPSELATVTLNLLAFTARERRPDLTNTACGEDPMTTRTTSEDDITAEVLERFDATANPRLKQIMQSLVRHAHAFVRTCS